MRSGCPAAVPRTVDRVAGAAAAFTMTALAVLHIVWATGSSWPAHDHAHLSEVVLGVPARPDHTMPAGGDHYPSPRACLAVAGALGTAAALTAGSPPRRPLIRRAGLTVVVTVLGARGLLGITGMTRLAVPYATGQTFVRWDRRAYGPLCLALAVLSSRAWPPRSTAPSPPS